MKTTSRSITRAAFILTIFAIFITGCSILYPPPPGLPPTRTPTQTSTPPPSPTGTQTSVPTATDMPAPTLAPPAAPTASPTPTLALPVAMNTVMPAPVGLLSPETLPSLKALARYGGPHIRSMSLSADEQTLAIATSVGIELYDASTRRLTAELPIVVNAHTPDSLSLSRDASRFLASTVQGIQVYNRAGDLLQTLPVSTTFEISGEEYPTLASLSPDGTLAVTRLCRGTRIDCIFEVRQVGDGSLVFSGPASLDGDTPRFTPDGLRVGAVSRATLRLWNRDGWTESDQVYVGANAYWTISPDSTLVAVQRLRNIEVRRLSDRRLIRLINRIEDSEVDPVDVLFSSSGNNIAALSDTGQLTVWDLRTGRMLSEQRAQYGELALFRLTETGLLSKLAIPNRQTGTGFRAPVDFYFKPDGSLRVVDDRTQTRPAQDCHIFPDGRVNCVSYDEQLIVDTIGNLSLLQINASGNLEILDLTRQVASTVAVFGWNVQPCWMTSPEGIFAFTRSHPNYPGREIVYIRHLGERTTLAQWPGEINNCARSTGRRYGVFQVDDPGDRNEGVHLVIMDLQTGQIVSEQEVLTRPDALALSPDNSWFATAAYQAEPAQNYLSLYPLVGQNTSESGALVLPSQDLGRRLSALQFSPDGNLLAAGFADGWLELFSVSQGVITRIPETGWQAHQDGILRLAFSADGALLATYSLDGYVMVWGISDRIE